MLILDGPQPSLPTHGMFSGHETFPFRYAWLKKGADGLLKGSDIFSREDAMVELGVGKNMVRSIRHWCLASQVAEESASTSNGRTRGIALSPLGQALFVEPAWDAYLEDDGSLWLLHWHLATNAARATTWYWAFNLFKEQDFTREGLTNSLSRLVEEKNWSRVSPASLLNDVSCFLRTYVSGRRGPASTAEETLDCPLTNLGLISETGDQGRYRFNVGAKPSLPDAIFCHALLDCWERRHSSQGTLSLREIVHGEGSPGRVFRLNDDAVLAYLDNLSDLTNGRLVFEDTVMVRQVAKHGDIAWGEVVNAYYD